MALRSVIARPMPISLR